MCAGSRAEKSTYLQVDGKVIQNASVNGRLPFMKTKRKNESKWVGKKVLSGYFCPPSCCVTVAFTTITIGFNRAYACNVMSGSRSILIEQQHGSDTQIVSMRRWIFQYIESIPENQVRSFLDKEKHKSAILIEEADSLFHRRQFIN